MPFFQNLRQFVLRLAPGQRFLLAAVLVGGLAVLGGIAYWAGQPDYALLFGRLEATDASRVVETLRSENIPYKLEEGGGAIYVPRQQVYDLRLRFAGEGVVSEGPVGYELFNSGTIGMTDFMQKLNYKRALEGELARTISNIRQVAQARVHLVLPERSPFRDRQTRPSASVVLQLGGGGGLAPDQIEGVASLVAGAVEGMSLSDVTVLDTRGTLLSNPDAGNPDITLSSNQLRTQHAVEEHLARSGQSMLDRMLGPGRAVVRVAAQLDFSRTVEETDAIDPESATIISEERLEEQAATDNSNATVRNYELSRKRERTERTAGAIDILTVSVVLDYKPPVQLAADTDEEPPLPEPEPYSPQQIREVEALVKNAVGFDPERGDRFAIHQARFDTSADDQLAEEMNEIGRNERFQLYFRYGLMALALGLAAFLIRSTVQSVANAESDPLALLAGQPPPSLTGRHTAGELAERDPAGANYALSAHNGQDPDAPLAPDDLYTSKLSAEAKARLNAKSKVYEEVTQSIVENPEEAAELLKTWIAEDLFKEDDASSSAPRPIPV
ncbi:MAG: flagellar M-ring protein FliF [Rhodothermaceae bacterium]|nr:flagellar M-ring protein FliF [Rhodothermaceae bacterium]